MWTEVCKAVALCGNGYELLRSHQKKGPREFNKIYAVKQRSILISPYTSHLFVAPNPHMVS
jgi:hypothetical protein